MSEVRRLIQWGMLLTVLTLLTIGIGSFLLYQEAFRTEEQALQDNLSTQAALIESVAAFDRVTSPEWSSGDGQSRPNGARAATLSQIERAFAASPGLGETGELVLGRQVNGHVQIFLHQRAEPSAPRITIPPLNPAAEPMRRALRGESGTVIAQDFRHETVLAAYRPLETLDWGLVAKKNLAEIRAPFVRSAGLAALIGTVLIAIGGFLFHRATDPLITRLRRSEARYAQLVEQAAEGIILIDTDDRVLIANPEAYRLFGIPEGAALGRSVHDFLPRSLSQTIMARMKERQAGVAEQYEFTLPQTDGDKRVRIAASPLLGPGGEYEGRMGLVTDITEEYQQRQAREAERQLLQTVLDTLPVGVWVLDENGRFRLSNPAGRDIWGAEEWSDLDTATQLHRFEGWDLETGQKLDDKDWAAYRALKGEACRLAPVEILAFDGQRRVILQAASPLYADDGRLNGAVVVAQDITDAHGRQIELSHERLLLASIMENLPVGVGVVAPDGHWLKSNPPMDALRQKYRDCTEAGDEHIHWADSGKPVAAGASPLARVLKGGDPVREEGLEYTLTDGDRLSILESVIPLSDHDGNLMGALVVDQDVTRREAMHRLLARNQQLLSLVLDNMPAGIAVSDESGRFMLANRRDEEIWGTSRLGHEAAEFGQRARDPDADAPVPAAEWPITRALQPPFEPVTDRIVEIDGAQGGRRILKLSVAPIIDEGNLLGAVELIEDITAERLAEARMRRLSTAVEYAGESVMVLDGKCRIEYANAAFEATTGYAADDVSGERPEDRLDAGQQPDGFYEGIWKRLRQGEKVHEIIVFRRKDGRLFYWDETLAPLMSPDGRLLEVVAIARDITERHEAEAALYRATREDPLTRLANHLALAEALTYRMERLQRSRRVIALALFDLSRFSHVNDALGYELGDAILRETAARLRAGVREGDVVARLGADTFAVLLTDLASQDDLPRVLHQLHAHLAPAFHVGGEELVVHHHAGIARAPTDAETPDDLLACAHIALDAAKRDPIEHVRYYGAKYGARATRQISLEAGLRKALANDTFELHFQPQVELADGRLRSLETLLRWEDPQLGVVSPGEFIPLAEQARLIGAIDEWVLEHALLAKSEWQRAGLTTGILAVNVSGARIADRNLPERVERALQQAGREPRELEIEVTETAAMQQNGMERRNLHLLREMGVSLAVDDFGTGYSSLAELSKLPFDILKIDQSFVRTLQPGNSAEQVVNTILSLAHAMDLKVIAEGIETPEQLTFLSATRCEYGQGFLFARPMPGTAVPEALRRTSWLPS